MAEGTDRWVSVETVAEFLGVSINWVYDHSRSGEIPSSKFGRHRRFWLPAIVEWADLQRVAS